MGKCLSKTRRHSESNKTEDNTEANHERLSNQSTTNVAPPSQMEERPQSTQKYLSIPTPSTIKVSNQGGNHEETQSAAVSVSKTPDKNTHSDTLTKNLVLLCEDMVATQVITRLESEKIITHVEADEIRAETTSYNANQKLLALVRKRGPEGLHWFILALEETKQYCLSSLFNQSSSGTDSIQQTSFKIKRSNYEQDLSCVRKMLKEMYLSSFKTTHPFSLPFTFDIESTWVSLALEDDESTGSTEDHADLLNRVFSKVKLLIIEGKPATGKTSLMRRIAYDWAKQIDPLKHYDVVIYAEFRRVREQQHKTIYDLIIGHLDSLSRKKKTTEISRLINDDEFLEKYRVLVLLDGYDESSLCKEQCEELHNFLNLTTLFEPLMFNIVVTTRSGHLSMHRGKKGRFVFADVLGFTTYKQKQKYILNHFSAFETDQTSNIQSVHSLLESNAELSKLAETPLFLTFICLVHEQIQKGTLLELYGKTLCWLLDRYQKNFLDCDVPLLFGYEHKKEIQIDKFQIIQDYFYEFPQLRILGNMAMHHIEKSEFSLSDIDPFEIESIVQKVGLLVQYEIRDALYQRRTEFSFPHRTIQEFLAAFAFFFSEGEAADAIADKFINKQHSLSGMQDKEVEKFLWRFASSSDMPIAPIRRSAFFERFTKDIVIDLNIFSSSSKNSARYLNVCLEKMSNVTYLYLKQASNSVLIFNEAIDFTKMKRLNYIYFYNGKKGAISFTDIPQNSQRSAPDPTHGLRPESFALMPENISGIRLDFIIFKSGKLFVKSMKYLLTLLKRECTIKLGSVKVQSNVELNSTFTVDTDMENISAFLPLKTVLEVFSDPDLNEALQYLSCANGLLIDRPEKAVDVKTFVDFPKLNRTNFAVI